ncbi:DNA replication licensing factor MCM7 [Nematocida sp. AWRm80]|nr:DNA replication licensing factor MCM7 [Nematocida sp. AWRm80]
MEDLRPYICTADYLQGKDELRRFLFTYEENGVLKYMQQIKCLSLSKRVDIDVADVLMDGNTVLYESMLSNTMRYREMVYEIVDEMVKNEEVDMPKDDIFFEHRKARVLEKYGDKSVFDVLSKAMLRYYSVNIYKKDRMLFNEVAPEIIGGLVCIMGIVSKVSEVHPSISVAVFLCDACMSEVFQEVDGESFLPLSECKTEKCKSGKVKGTLHLQTRPSKFRAKQIIKIQELSSETLPGRVPRSITVEVYDENVRKVSPGTEVIVSGIFLPKPNEGIQKMTMGLLSNTYILGTMIEPFKKKRTDNAQLSSKDAEDPAEQNENNASMQNESTSEKGTESIIVQKMQPLEDISLMTNSIAPEIAGMEDVKKLLLLMLIGGDDYTEGGMRIRGEINVLLVGDPGVAKSQLLKAVCRLSPRGMFTTGRGASGAGLTACVTRDPETGEYRLEGGALVMSDGGICCIDEFDKMHESDRSCVHEAMEQHRISISKAGINTTLNARCSVLAAANPIKGRYVDKKSVAWNAGLPSALISRFDVVKVLRDTAGKNDQQICRHILAVHRARGKAMGTLSPEALTKYIAECKEITTSIGPGVQERIIQAYTSERAKALRDPSKTSPGTARRVLSVLRFSQALAKAHKRSVISVEDVEEVLRLLDCKDTASVYEIIMSIPGEEFDDFRIIDLETVYREGSKLFTAQEIKACINTQISQGSWSLLHNRLTIFKV